MGERNALERTFLEALGQGGTATTSSLLHARMLQHVTEQHVSQTPVLCYPDDVAPNEFVFLGR